MGNFREKLAAAFAALPIDPINIQDLFNKYKKHLDGKIIPTPLEQIQLLEINFPHWIKLEEPHPTNDGEWVDVTATIVVASLNAGTFDQTKYRFNDLRADAILNVSNILREPNCIHRSLRKQQCHIYVMYRTKQRRTVAISIYSRALKKVILSTSFRSDRQWVNKNAEMPAVWEAAGCKCTCQIEKGCPLEQPSSS